jgi:transcriptional antiterminator NusG
VPTEEVVELKSGQKAVTERKFFPGYVLVEMDHGRRDLAPREAHEQGHRLRRRCATNRPAPISEAEVDEDRRPDAGRRREAAPEGAVRTVGELVRVKEGPFTDFNGAVEEVNYEKSKVRVSVTIFGRATPVELDFAQVEKV